MRMSKSIKDYKDAMDNIKISDSFHKRTETMLTELSEVKIEKKSSFGGGKLTSGIMAAAACIVCVIGLRIALDGRESGIDTTVTETITEAVTDTAPELIEELEKEDDIFAELAGPASNEDSYDGGAAVSEAADEEMDDSAAETTAAETRTAEDKSSPLSAEEKGTAAPVAPAETAAPVTTAAAAAPTAMAAPETTAPAGAGGAPAQDGAYTGGEGYPDITVHGYENIPMMDDISYGNVTVEITPYFDMGNIRSGEGSVKQNGTEFAPVIDFIADVAASAAEISNYSFRTVFSMRIADENIGVTFYSIYLTDSDTLVITKHSADVQQRVTYLMEQEDYENLKHTLFLMFGAESDYRLFESLVSGK